MDDLTIRAEDGTGTSHARRDALLPSQAILAAVDIVDGIRRWYLWTVLGWQDIRQRYRRSVIGPFWLTISMGVMVGALGLLYAGLFSMDVSQYLPFLALGFITWGLLSSLINEGCNSFIEANAIIKQVRLPLSIHVYRIVWRNLIIFAHNMLIFVVVAIIFAVWPGWPVLLSVAGLALLCLNGAWVGILLGLLSARFRDVPQIVASIVQVAFFVTPIIWKPESLPNRVWLLTFNPFYHLMEVVRTPLLGGVPGIGSWLIVIGITCTGWLVTFEAYRRYRSRIAYWV